MTLNDTLVAQMNRMMSPGTRLEVPPKAFVDMGGEFVDYQEGQTLSVRFPVKERYQNPMGHMQGGMIVAAIDNTLGPLSFLVASPSVTTQLNTSYIRPVTAEDEHIIITGRVLERTRSQLFMMAEVTNAVGKLVAVGYATCSILGQ